MIRRSLLAAAATAVALVALAALPAAPAVADADVTVTNDRGTGQADTRYRTALTIRGSGFQVVRGGFGGVYVMFGWVRDPGGGSWRPSRGGLTGQDYRYIPDSENAAANQGYLRFIAFPGSSTAGEANAVLSNNGGFTVDLTVPGPVFESVDRSGAVRSVDCRRVTCGVITIGAHGVKNPENESFTRVDFGSVYDQAPPAAEQPGQSGQEAPATTPESADVAPQQPTAPAAGGRTPRVATGPAAVTVDRATAVAGRALTFTARGFTPGEQVVAVLDDGAAALGPMTAGAAGEVAGVVVLPPDTAVGTHELRLTGAASGTEVTQNFPVAAGPSSTDGADPVAEETPALDRDEAGILFLAAAGLLFVLALVGFLVRRRRGRRTAQPASPAVGATA